MPSVNQASLRDEFARLKSEYGALSAAGKVPAETGVLMSAVFVLLELMVAIFLEKTTKKGSGNSSIPSSQNTTADDSAADTAPGTKSRGPGGQGQRFAGSRTVESEAVAPVTTCGCCGQDLSGVEPEGHERRTRIDIVFEKRVEHVDAQIKTCPSCAKTTKGEFAADLMGPLQYGLGVKAYVVNLLVCQMVSLNRAAKLMHSMLGQLISEATMLRHVMELHVALARWEQATVKALLAAPVIHLDETSMKVDGTNHWVHVVSAGDLVLKRLHPNRGLEAMRAHDIVPRYGGVKVHDCWASYFSTEFSGSTDALCGAHLLRELAFAEDANGYAWAGNVRRLLQQACHEVSESEAKCLDGPGYARLQRRYRNLLTRAERELPPIPVRPNGRGGKVAKSDAHNLCERLRKHEAAVLLFAKEPLVPFTNNRAERDLRMGKVKQKVSGCFRTERYAKAYCRISSYLQSMAYRGINPLVAIQLALSGQLYAEK